MLAPELMQQVRRLQIRTKRLVDDLFGGRYESVFRGQGMEFREVRAYVPGDDVRIIDWNVTARTGHPHVKILTEERELTVMLVVDASGSGFFGSVERFKTELAAEFCAVIALSAIRNNDRVGLVVFSDTVELYVKPGKGRRHVLRLIRELLFFKPRGKRTNIPAALYFLDSILKRRSIVFLVSDFMADNYELALTAANRRHDVIAVSIEDDSESSLPDVGWLAVIDPETGQETVVNTSEPALRAAYSRAAESHRELRNQILRRARTDGIHLKTGQSYVEALRRFFSLREKRHG